MDLDFEAIAARAAQLSATARPRGDDPNSIAARVRAARTIIDRLREAGHSWAVIAKSLDICRKDGAAIGGDHLRSMILRQDWIANGRPRKKKKKDKPPQDQTDRDQRRDTVPPRPNGQAGSKSQDKYEIAAEAATGAAPLVDVAALEAKGAAALAAADAAAQAGLAKFLKK